MAVSIPEVRGNRRLVKVQVLKSGPVETGPTGQAATALYRQFFIIRLVYGQVLNSQQYQVVTYK